MIRPVGGPRCVPVLLAVAALAVSASAAAPGPVPGEGWTAYRSPSDAGFDPERLATALERLDDIAPSSFLVVRAGNVAVARGSVDRSTDAGDLGSILLSTMAGLRIADGAFRLEDRLGQLEMRDVDPDLTELQRTATVADLLGRTSCVAHPSAGETVPEKMERGRHLGHAPGTHVWLQPWDLNALATLLERDAPRGLSEDVGERIARPLELEDLSVSDVSARHDLALSIHPTVDVRASARDLARLGLLFLRRGAWGDRRVLPESWIARSTAPRADEPDGHARGLLFKVYRGEPLGPLGAYSLGTESGRLLAVVPGRDLVAVLLAEEGRASPADLHDLLADLAAAAVRAPLAEVELAPLSFLSAPTAELRVDPDVLRSYEGVYRLECDLTARVRYAENGLEVHLGAGYLSMVPVSETEFVLESTGERVFFQPDARPPIPRFVHRPFVERLGGCYTLLERYDDAVRLFRLNAERYPEHAEAWLQLAEALVLTHRVEDALAAAREAAALEPDNERAARLVRQLSQGTPVEDLGHGHRH